MEEHATFPTPPSLAALGPRITVYFEALAGSAKINGVWCDDGGEVRLTDEQRETVRGMVVARYPAPEYHEIRNGSGKARDASRNVQTSRTRAVHYRPGSRT